MQTAPPAPLNETLDLGEGTIDEMSTNNSTGNTLINPMDIDRHESDTTSTFTSNSFGKRKLDVITSDEELNAATTTISENPIPLSSKLSSPIVSSRGPAKKKTSSLPRSLPKSRNTSSSQSSQPSRVQSTSTKMTPTIIAHEIQGSINSLASAVRESGSTDPVAKLRQEAIHCMSDGDDGLSATDKIALIDLFRKDYAAVQTYVALLKHDELRQPWLEKQLRELQG
ncbi:hypothetical protein BYT27DRAFT_7251495 [Phlegmacium glaucopus]|nr:hypothetical protein BYT27DRAFT_7251495 [Phlegmacium glaucopus]